MKRIKNIGDIPSFLSNQRYDDFYQELSKDKLKKEIVKRHTLYSRVQHVLNNTYIIESDFTKDKKKSKRLNKKNDKKKIVTVKITRSITVNGEKKILPPQPTKTKDEIIQEERDSIVRTILCFTTPLWQDTLDGRKLNYQSSDFTILPGFNFDDTPIITPIMSDKNYSNFGAINPFFEVLPRNLDDYKKMPNIYINLDFSDDAIIEEIKNQLAELREIKNHKPVYLKNKTYINKLINYRILQVMDIILWQVITNHYIQYDALALFLYPRGKYSGKQLKETIMPLSKNLLDSRSNDSGFFYYIVNKNDEK
ncbi:DUF6387 family protein [Acinetobacter sp. ANC 5033]|uniref:DUF6387 family protein n=1 Tax=Acinetobacter amyesii TaxID=2942470 RepID=UPI00201B95F0|nr:DUF6387 family protein [Acinetobacter amyesii]MCL6238772.1 DUF6387 family protein [Acinetobacter amyesii]